MAAGSVTIDVAVRLEEVGRLKTLALKSGDVFVIESPRPLPQATREHISQMFVREFPPGHRCVVLDDGLTLKVARAAEDE